MKIRSKVLLAPSVAIVMLVMIAAFAVAMTWQLKSQITAFPFRRTQAIRGLAHRARASQRGARPGYRTLNVVGQSQQGRAGGSAQEDRRGDCRHGRAARRRPQGTARQRCRAGRPSEVAKTLDRAMELSAVELATASQ